MKPRSHEVAQRLLVITLALEDSAHGERLAEFRALLDERDRVLRELETCPADRETLETLSRVRVAEGRVLSKLATLRSTAVAELARGQTERRATKTYSSSAGRKGSFDQSR